MYVKPIYGNYIWIENRYLYLVFFALSIYN